MEKQVNATEAGEFAILSLKFLNIQVHSMGK
jgi:hypothetical protein